MYILCEKCGFKGRSVESWNLHLLSENHQQIVSFSPAWKSQNADVTYQAVIFSEFKKRQKYSNLLSHFTSFGFIQDFCVYHANDDNSISACLVTFDSMSKADDFMNSRLELSQETLGFGKAERVYKLRPPEWGKTMGYDKQSQFNQRHVKIADALRVKVFWDQFHAFFDMIKLTDEEIYNRGNLIADLQNIINEQFPFTPLVLIGSYAYGLADRFDEVDVFVSVDGQRNAGCSISQHKELQLVYEIAVLLFEENKKGHRFDNELGWVEKKIKALHPFFNREPYIYLVDKKFNIPVKLSMSSEIARSEAEVIAFFIRYDDRVEKLMLIVKYWAKVHELVTSDGFSTYSLMLLVIVFLNQKRIIPCVEYLQSLPNIGYYTVNNINVSFETDVEVVKQSVSTIACNFTSCLPSHVILHLASDFFEFYGDLDFSKYAVCPFYGIHNQEKAICKSESHRKKPTFREIENGHPYRYWWDGIVVVQDIFQRERNVTRKIQKPTLQKFQSLCKQTVDNFDALFLREQLDPVTCQFMDVFRKND